MKQMGETGESYSQQGSNVCERLGWYCIREQQAHTNCFIPLFLTSLPTLLIIL